MVDQTPTTETQIMTRRDYMSDPDVTYDAYYSQFVTERTMRQVEDSFGAQALREALAEDPRLNTIALKRWDALTTRQVGRTGRFVSTLDFDRSAIAAAGETVTRAVLVCIAKRAAVLVVEATSIAEQEIARGMPS